jgi:pimeloyl-ACP methyl ester carboxylesterase
MFGILSAIQDLIMMNTTLSNGHIAPCAPSTFNPAIFGVDIYSIDTQLISGYDFRAGVTGGVYPDLPVSDPVSLSFCNVSVSYTHPGQGDNITVTAWLPVNDWNGRMLGVGGGGWVAGGPNSQSYALAAGIASGYASTTTDAGLNLGADASASGWALVSPGNVHLYNLQNLASVSLHDQALIGKSLIADFYARPPDKSYWNGCSQGGRQGMMLAQRYPTLYDGIVAGAPAITWTAFVMGIFWPQLFMNLAGMYPYPCELDAITAAAVSACDGLDGVLDKVISNEYACNFDPFSVVGTEFNCSTTNTIKQISHGAAAVANATWSGPHTTDNQLLWYGPRIGSDLTGGPTRFAAAATTCDANGCVGAPLIFGVEWITLFIEKNPDFNLSAITPEQYEDIFHAGRQEFSSMVDTDDPDLSRFRDNGGKLLSFHGTVSDLLFSFSPLPQSYSCVPRRLSEI